MAPAEPTGYDGLSSRLVGARELRVFLRDCFGIGDRELFVGHADRVSAELESVRPEVGVFAAFCTYWEVSGHFSMGFSLGIDGRSAARVPREEFAEAFAAHFDAFVLYGDREPPGLWTVVLADGSRLLAQLDEGDGHYLLDAATAPLPGLPEVRVNEGLGRV